MAFYRDCVVPLLIHCSMKSAKVARLRQRVVPAARGRVLEIGIGSGLNLPFYGGEVTSVTGIDPSDALLRRAIRAKPAVKVELEIVPGSAEALPFEAGAFDTVLTTWTLCTIPDVTAALDEVQRVLKPAGSMVFIEHGRAPEAGVRRWQDRLNPLWRRCSGGCNMNREIFSLVEGAGFDLRERETGYMVEGPRVLTFLYRGIAAPR